MRKGNYFIYWAIKGGSPQLVPLVTSHGGLVSRNGIVSRIYIDSVALLVV